VASCRPSPRFRPPEPREAESSAASVFEPLRRRAEWLFLSPHRRRRPDCVDMPRSTPPLSADTMVDRAVAIALVVNLGWTTWHLGGFVGEAMAVSFPVLMLTLALVVVRWLVWRPTGLPVGWWWPLPMLAVVGSHLAGVAPM